MSDTKRSPAQPPPKSPLKLPGGDKIVKGHKVQHAGLGLARASALLLLGLMFATAIFVPRFLNFVNQTGAASLVLQGPAASPQLPQQLATLRGQEIAQLNGYGWVNQAAGIAHIPIARAIALIGEQGLPVGQPAIPTKVPTAEQPTVSAPVTSVDPAVDLPVDLTNVNFQDNVLPIFEQHCSECHGDKKSEEGLKLTSYRSAIGGSQNGTVIEPGNPDKSYLVKMITTGKMPKKGPPLSPAEIETVIAWIKAGAPEKGATSTVATPIKTTVDTSATVTATLVTATTTVTPTAATPTAATSATVTSTLVVTQTVVPPTVDLANVDLANVSFQANVLPIFQQHCSECHGDKKFEEGLKLTAYRSILGGSQNGLVIKPGEPDKSYLVKMIVTKKMPKKGPPLSAAEIEIIIAWIKAGALDN